MLIQDRVKMIIKSQSLSASEFADEIGVKRSNLSHVLNGRNKPSLDFLTKIVNAYPNVDASWLLTGNVKSNSGTDQKELFDELDAASGNTTKVSVQSETAEIDRIVVFFKDGRYKNFREES